MILNRQTINENSLFSIQSLYISIFGHKVNTCVPGTKPINGMYPACKFAMTALTECLRQEIAYVEMGIKVSVSV